VKGSTHSVGGEAPAVFDFFEPAGTVAADFAFAAGGDPTGDAGFAFATSWVAVAGDAGLAFVTIGAAAATITGFAFGAAGIGLRTTADGRVRVASSRFGIWTTTGSAGTGAVGAGAAWTAGVAAVSVAARAVGAGAGSESRAPTSCSLPRGRTRSTITVVTIPQAKVIRQIPARLLFDSTISALSGGDDTVLPPPSPEIRSVRFIETGMGVPPNLFCDVGVGVAPLFD
jgi:hypothetical protein